MKGSSIKWITAAVVLVTMTASPGFAAKKTPATNKNSAVPVVPRAIPNLIPYHKFDPPTSKMFDMNKLNISGDIRVRPEFRNQRAFGLDSTTLPGIGDALINSNSSRTDSFVQQWIRLGLHYTISPDVVFFFQPQHSKSWGVTNVGISPNSGADYGNEIFARQGFMLVRNFLVKDLTVKLGRQLVVWGNHRMFGHFDWNNVGFSFDGVTTNYKVNSQITAQSGWLRVNETECTTATGNRSRGGCGNNNTGTGEATSNDGDVFFVRVPMKMGGVVFEPTWIWHAGGTGGTLSGARPSNQSRHTVGGRVTTKRTMAGGLRLDGTIEGYYQFGEIGLPATGRFMDIQASAFHVDAGVTLPVPMQPRIGGEFNIASGDDQANCDSEATCGGTWSGFDQLYPTNHIHFGYVDRMAWKNMVHFTGSLNLRPTPNSHLDISGHKFYLNNELDNWYGANQNIFFRTPDGNTEDDLGSEIDVVYTLFFTPGNNLSWQIGGGVLFPGDYIDSRVSGDADNHTWGYTQLWINW